jgi:hypothetical protein
MLAGELLNSLIRKEFYKRTQKRGKNKKNPGETSLNQDQKGRKLLPTSTSWPHPVFYELKKQSTSPHAKKCAYYAPSRFPN